MCRASEVTRKPNRAKKNAAELSGARWREHPPEFDNRSPPRNFSIFLRARDLLTEASFTMTDSTKKDRKWQRSSIGITPLTVRPRAGQRRVSKFDVTGDNLPGPAAPEVQGQSGGSTRRSNPLIIAPASAAGEGDGRAERVVLTSSSASSSAAVAGRAPGARVCSVCTRASADYSCPRCLIGYCSSTCYKVSSLCLLLSRGVEAMPVACEVVYRCRALLPLLRRLLRDTTQGPPSAMGDYFLEIVSQLAGQQTWCPLSPPLFQSAH